MRTLLAACALVALASADPLVVHEWGTFTSIQGSDGVALEGLQHEEEALPGFVHSRREPHDPPRRGEGCKGVKSPVSGVTQKMETPIVYFYAKEPRRLRVRVDFRNGLLSQWYPAADRLGPAEPDGAPLDFRTLGGSFLEWEIDLLRERPAGVPEVAADDPWSFAREVGADWLRTAPRDGTARPGPAEGERYLFYRGLGRFDAPVEVRCEKGGLFRIRGTRDAVPEWAILAEIRGGAVRLSAPLSLSGEPSGPVALAEASAARLEKEVVVALVGAGLFDDEAVAMVRTWSRSWFSSDGTRLLYLMPRRLVDEQLPLSIVPAPETLVRVLLGRLECVTPEVEREIADALGAEDAPQRLGRFGRFLEPHLRRVLALPLAPDARARGEAMLREAAK